MIARGAVTRALRVALMVVFLVLGTGCAGNRMRPVRGRVHFADDSPLRTGKVILDSVDGLHGASGMLAEDGSFELGSLKATDGVPPGQYRVSIVGAAEPPASEADFGKPPRYLIHPRYFDPAKSGLTFEVKPEGENVLDITVQKPGKK